LLASLLNVTALSTVADFPIVWFWWSCCWHLSNYRIFDSQRTVYWPALLIIKNYPIIFYIQHVLCL
jgi:hypothetical protein